MTEDRYQDLIRRLRGEYRIPITDNLGPVKGNEEPNNSKEFVRTFDTTPINREAADAIEELLRGGSNEAPTIEEPGSKVPE